MAWQRHAAWRPVRESEEGAWLPELSGLGRSRGGGGGREVAETVPITATPLAHWQLPRVASGGEHRGSLPAASWGSGSELNPSQAEEEGWGQKNKRQRTDRRHRWEHPDGALAARPGPLSQGSPPAGPSRLDFTAVETETGNTFFSCALNAWFCLFAFSICSAVALKSAAGWIILVVCSEAFKGTLTKHPRYTMIFSPWILPIVSKEKSPSLKYSFGCECSDFVSCHWQGINFWILEALAMRQARGWESLTRKFGSHTGSWDLQILTLWTINIQGVGEAEFSDIHTRGWEKKWHLYFCWYLRFSIPLQYGYRKQTIIVLVNTYNFVTSKTHRYFHVISLLFQISLIIIYAHHY